MLAAPMEGDGIDEDLITNQSETHQRRAARYLLFFLRAAEKTLQADLMMKNTKKSGDKRAQSKRWLKGMILSSQQVLFAERI
jgi:hypothetical protein